MNQFCEMKGILRQFSVARTSQQNEVDERRNRTLIKAARTMLADSKLPTTFWAKVVNTACYVQNRVLVVKPHNKTPYELLHGRTPTLSFMGPFKYLVTILNAKDHLGSEPNWLFDIDALTKTMNYEPIVAGTQSNGFADPKISHDDGFKPSSDDGKKVDEDPRKENECNDQEKEDNVNSTNNVNTVSSTVNVAGTNENNELPIDPNMPALEDVSTFNFSSDDEDDAKSINGEAQIHARVDDKKIFDSMDMNFDNLSGKFLMYPRNMRRIGKGFLGRITPLFPTMVELGDSLVRATTIASILEVEQDSGNINSTKSKATPNESSSQETSLGGGPRCQEAMGDTIAQTRFENVSKLSNDSLLARGNTLQSDEDELKLNELMELCTNLQTRVLDLEKTKTTQANVIDSLKKRVKKLERRNKSRTHKLKRLYKVCLTDRVESLDNEDSLGEDASKHERRINDIDADEDITLVNVQADAEMFDADKDLGGEEVFVEQEVVADKEKNDEVTLAQALAELKTSNPKPKGVIIQEPKELVKPKKKDQIRLDEEAALKLQAELDEEQTLAREKAKKEIEANIALIETWDDKRRKFFAAKRAEEKRNKPLTQAQKRKIMCIYLKNMEGYILRRLKEFEFDKVQKMFDKAFKRVNTFKKFRTELVQGQEKEKRVREELIQKRAKKQKVEDDKETENLKQLMKIIPDEEEVAIDAIPLAVKSPRIVELLSN
nr:putative ribonuclease H-like domain-containing protein [Tanacetum cinerariifolium]